MKKEVKDDSIKKWIELIENITKLPRNYFHEAIENQSSTDKLKYNLNSIVERYNISSEVIKQILAETSSDDWQEYLFHLLKRDNNLRELQIILNEDSIPLIEAANKIFGNIEKAAQGGILYFSHPENEMITLQNNSFGENVKPKILPYILDHIIR